jgi:hypothetical protein
MLEVKQLQLTESQCEELDMGVMEVIDEELNRKQFFQYDASGMR